MLQYLHLKDEKKTQGGLKKKKKSHQMALISFRNRAIGNPD